MDTSFVSGKLGRAPLNTIVGVGEFAYVPDGLSQNTYGANGVITPTYTWAGLTTPAAPASKPTRTSNGWPEEIVTRSSTPLAVTRTTGPAVASKWTYVYPLAVCKITKFWSPDRWDSGSASLESRSGSSRGKRKPDRKSTSTESIGAPPSRLADERGPPMKK